MQDASHTDRRYSQTQDRYAADDLETMQEARRYSDHVFGLVRGFLGSRVLEVGSGIGTMTSRLVDVADIVVGIEPNPNCATRIQEAMGHASAVHAPGLPLRGVRRGGAHEPAVRFGSSASTCSNTSLKMWGR